MFETFIFIKYITKKKYTTKKLNLFYNDDEDETKMNIIFTYIIQRIEEITEKKTNKN